MVCSYFEIRSKIVKSTLTFSSFVLNVERGEVNTLTAMWCDRIVLLKYYQWCISYTASNSLLNRCLDNSKGYWNLFTPDWQLNNNFYIDLCMWTNSLETNRPFVHIRHALISLFRIDFEWKLLAGSAVQPDSATEHQMSLIGTVSYAALFKASTDSDKRTSQETPQLNVFHYFSPLEALNMFGFIHWKKNTWKATFYMYIFSSHTLLWGSSWIINVKHLSAPYSRSCSCSEGQPWSHL